MLVPFEKLNPQSKIWIYQTDRVLSESQQEIVITKTSAFLQEWTAHGNSLEAGVEIRYNQFIIIGVNEAVNEASGCSIDKSVGFIRELGNLLNIDLLERSNVAIKNENQIRLISFTEIRKMVLGKEITPETEIFNQTVTSKKELENNWILPAGKSWLKKYF
jgi:hypothetical protein